MNPDNREWLRQVREAADQFITVACGHPLVPVSFKIGAQMLVEGEIAKAANWAENGANR